MFWNFFLSFALSLVVLSVFAPTPLLAKDEIVPDHYIVVFKEEVGDPDSDSEDLKLRHGLGKKHVYRHALKGFSAMIPAEKLDRVKEDPRVAYVAPDRLVHTMAETLPSGIDRVNAEVSTAAGRIGLRGDNSQPVDVAIIDTGIELFHPDLTYSGTPNPGFKQTNLNAKIAGNINFVRTDRSGNDDNGHGTHVAGTVAAIANDSGVVGVGPRIRLWAVKVLNRKGSGTWSGVIAGVDWVTASRTDPSREPIEAANMSLGGGGSDDGNCGNTNNDPLHKAICRSVTAGVTYVVAAGNSSVDAKGSVPASYDEVITVSALADSDGQPGGLGPATSYGNDDTFATFSNFGADVDLIAPGVSILSTYKGQTYARLSGTSMATPHVAGAAALYIAANPGATPSQVLSGLLATAIFDWKGSTDPDLTHEPRVDACRASGLTACP